jgi:hypothetical protein
VDDVNFEVDVEPHVVVVVLAGTESEGDVAGGLGWGGNSCSFTWFCSCASSNSWSCTSKFSPKSWLAGESLGRGSATLSCQIASVEQEINQEEDGL